MNEFSLFLDKALEISINVLVGFALMFASLFSFKLIFRKSPIYFDESKNDIKFPDKVTAILFFLWLALILIIYLFAYYLVFYVL